MGSETQRHKVIDLISSGVLNIGDGYRAKNEELGSSGIPFARAGNIDGGFNFNNADYFPKENLPIVGNKISKPGDVVFTSKGTVGRFSFVQKDTPQFVYSPQLCYWRVLDPNIIDPRFLFFWMQGHEFFTQYNSVKGQTDMADYVSLSDQRRMHITLPPPHEQRAIARVLGSLDDKIELNRKMNATLEETARAIFQSWFVDFDPVRAKAAGQAPVGLDAATAALFPAAFEEVDGRMVPQGWDLGVLDDLTEFAIGGDWGSEQPNEINTIASYCIRGADIPFLQGGDLGKMPSRYIKPSSLNKRMLQKGDIVIEVSGGSPTQSTGRSIIILESLLKGLTYPLVYSNFCRMIRLENKAYANYIYLWLRWVYSGDEFLQFENGTTGIKNLAFTLFCQKHRLTIPPLNIIQKFNGIIDNIFLVRQLNAAQSRTLAELRDTLLPRLLSGELRVRDVEPLL